MQPLLPRILSIFLSTNAGSIQNNVAVGVPVRSITSNISTKFVLVDTKHPGNVGATARAMKTMGFSELAVVSPSDERVLGRKKCIDGASGAVSVLNNAAVFENVRDVFKDTDDEVIICGTGMPVDMSLERVPQRYVAPREFFEELLYQKRGTGENISADNEKKIQLAFLFGNERFGMKPEDMELCDVMLGIPTNPEFGSLNVATAVQIIAYDWRQAMGGFDYHK